MTLGLSVLRYSPTLAPPGLHSAALSGDPNAMTITVDRRPMRRTCRLRGARSASAEAGCWTAHTVFVLTNPSSVDAGGSMFGIVGPPAGADEITAGHAAYGIS